MSPDPLTPARGRFGRWTIIVPVALLVFGLTFFVYFKTAFPEVRCEFAKHLDSPQNVSDCYECHIKATPKLAQDWHESKHGVMLVKCFVCHGQPDGKGSVPYTANPDVETTCTKCHDPSIREMEHKYGSQRSCGECHPYHQNSLHHKAYTRQISKKTMD